MKIKQTKKWKKRVILSLLTAKVLSSIVIITPEMDDEKAMDIITNRNGKLVVEYCYSKANADGVSGTTEQGYYVAYNKKVKQGKRVLTIAVMNPNNNYEDDFILVYDNGIWR